MAATACNDRHGAAEVTETPTFTPTATMTSTATPTATMTPTPEPTPTMTPTPTPVAPTVPAPSYNSCPDVITQVFGANAGAACRVAFCESSWNPNATGAAGERGLFQIHPAYHYDSTYDPLGNTLAAYRISSGGTNWSAWSCRWAAQP